MAREQSVVMTELVKVSTQSEDAVKAEYGLRPKQVLRVLRRLVYRELQEENEADLDDLKKSTTPQVRKFRKGPAELQETTT